MHNVGISVYEIVEFLFDEYLFLFCVFYPFQLFDFLGAVHFDCGCVECWDSVGNSKGRRSFHRAPTKQKKTLLKWLELNGIIYSISISAVDGKFRYFVEFFEVQYTYLWSYSKSTENNNNQSIAYWSSLLFYFYRYIFRKILNKTPWYIEDIGRYQTKYGHRTIRYIRCEKTVFIFSPSVEMIYLPSLENRDSRRRCHFYFLHFFVLFYHYHNRIVCPLSLVSVSDVMHSLHQIIIIYIVHIHSSMVNANKINNR